TLAGCSPTMIRRLQEHSAPANEPAIPPLIGSDNRPEQQISCVIAEAQDMAQKDFPMRGPLTDLMSPSRPAKQAHGGKSAVEATALEVELSCGVRPRVGLSPERRDSAPLSTVTMTPKASKAGSSTRSPARASERQHDLAGTLITHHILRAQGSPPRPRERCLGDETLSIRPPSTFAGRAPAAPPSESEEEQIPAAVTLEEWRSQYDWASPDYKCQDQQDDTRANDSLQEGVYDIARIADVTHKAMRRLSRAKHARETSARAIKPVNMAVNLAKNFEEPSQAARPWSGGREERSGIDGISDYMQVARLGGACLPHQRGAVELQASSKPQVTGGPRTAQPAQPQTDFQVISLEPEVVVPSKKKKKQKKQKDSWHGLKSLANAAHTFASKAEAQQAQRDKLPTDNKGFTKPYLQLANHLGRIEVPAERQRISRDSRGGPKPLLAKKQALQAARLTAGVAAFLQQPPSSVQSATDAEREQDVSAGDADFHAQDDVAGWDNVASTSESGGVPKAFHVPSWIKSSAADDEERIALLLQEQSAWEGIADAETERLLLDAEREWWKKEQMGCWQDWDGVGTRCESNGNRKDGQHPTLLPEEGGGGVGLPSRASSPVRTSNWQGPVVWAGTDTYATHGTVIHTKNTTSMFPHSNRPYSSKGAAGEHIPSKEVQLDVAAHQRMQGVYTDR
ncbi:hypothetical protein CYMTET_34377, partial [Cymbomonas tetramitiformis]